MPTLPRCRILAIGDELLLGRVVDTNSAWLARWAGDRGMTVSGIHIVGDAFQDGIAAIHQATSNAEVVIITGGLGPTEDDRTRHALAAVMGVDLVEVPAAWKAITAYFLKHGFGTPAAVNRRQALFPMGASLLSNDRGTAPGLLAQCGTCMVACLPGVPHEMEAMAGRLAKQLPRLVLGLRRPTVKELYLASIGESSAQELMQGLMTEVNPQVGITASELGHLCVRVVGTPAQVSKRMTQLRHCFRGKILPAPGLAPSLVRTLARQGGTFAAAESCTAGQVVAQLASAPGASAVLHESVVTYHADSKTAWLKIPKRFIEQHGVVSQQVVEAMAVGLRKRTGCTLAVATTGIAGPGGGTRETPIGLVWTAAATERGVRSRSRLLRGTRVRVQQRAAAQALQLGWELLNERD